MVDVEFSATLTGARETISVLALVCPEPSGPDHISVIVGTNANLFHRLAALCKSADTYTPHSLRILPQTPVVKLSQSLLMDVEEHIGEVRWMGPGPLVVPASGKRAAVCKVNCKNPLKKDILMAETPHSVSLPAGVLIQPVVLTSSELNLNSFKVLMRNETTREAALLPGTVIAHVFHTDIVTTTQRPQTTSKVLDERLFDFGKSPCPEAWRKRVRQKLSVRGDVFSLDEWDVGLAQGVEHPIRLSDPRPFRERSRRIALADIDDVHRHLKDLLAAGIIKESRSLYASPIVIDRKKNGSVRMCEHEERLLKVLDRLEECGLKVSLDKCQFCQPQVKYIRHVVSAAGIATDPEKVSAVRNWKMPTDLKSLRSFLGFCGYYRRFVKNYSAIVRPLKELTKGYPPTRNGHKVALEKAYFKEREPFGERWDEECTKAFHDIIHCLTHAPVLAFADPAKPYVLYVDASLNGLGAVLNQEYPEGLRPVAFASRKLSASEQRYPIHQLEFLALKWSVVDKFHDYLYGAKFTVRTDNNPLTYVLTSAKLNATGHRWLSALATYDFKVQYHPGSHNIDCCHANYLPLKCHRIGQRYLSPG